MSEFYTLEEGRFFLWLPVFLAIGIGSYFSLPIEPTSLLVGAVFLVILCLAWALNFFLHWLMLAAILTALVSGVALAKLRTELVRAPIISKVKGFYLVEGRLERLTQLPGQVKRLQMTNLVLSGLAPHQTPYRLRMTSRIKDKPLIVGARIKVRAILRPPPGPVRPGGFDFARQAWYSRIGAVGFAVSKVQIVEEAAQYGLWPGRERFRQTVTREIKEVTTGSGGDIALALIVGEKRSINKGVLASIRAAGLAHMLAISGMHMALVSGTLFWLMRALLALSQTLALSFDVRKIAAIAAIISAAGYYQLSGMGISTLRAFIMITIMFLAVILGRKAISLRNVSLAALLILVFFPESLLSVGFQMSFASVVALVAFYESTHLFGHKAGSEIFLVRMGDKIFRAAFAIFTTTLIAGFAVAPIAVYHFHHITSYSVLGNMLAMPVLSAVVMPMALVALIAMPLNLHATPLFIMGQGNQLIVEIASYVAGFEGARINVGTIDPAALLLILFGGLWLCLWRSFYRFAGLFLILVGLVLSPYRSTPFLLIERDGKNVMLIDKKGAVWPMMPRVGRYSVDRWRSAFGALNSPQKDHDKVSQNASIGQHNKGRWRCDQYGCTVLYHAMIVAYSSHPGALAEDCARADILIATYPVPSSLKMCDRVKKIIDIKILKRNGSHAFYLDNDQLNSLNSRQTRGRRPWARQN